MEHRKRVTIEFEQDGWGVRLTGTNGYERWLGRDDSRNPPPRWEEYGRHVANGVEEWICAPDPEDHATNLRYETVITGTPLWMSVTVNGHRFFLHSDDPCIVRASEWRLGHTRLLIQAAEEVPDFTGIPKVYDWLRAHFRKTYQRIYEQLRGLSPPLQLEGIDPRGHPDG